MAEQGLTVIMAPAYNEAESLPDLLAAIPPALGERPYRVLIVDDGSSDATAEVVRDCGTRMPAEVVQHAHNRGLGAALRTGLEAAARVPGAAVVVTLDADNTHPPSLIPTLLAAMEDGGYDVVIASRYAPGGAEMGLSYLRHVLSRGASFLLGTFAPLRGARDYTCGFRAYRREILERAFAVYGDKLIEESGFACMAEVLLKIGLLGAKVGERGLVLRYDLKRGQSKMRIWRTMKRYGALIWAARTRWRKVAEATTGG
ncbi:MAG: glycosyltransferase family 2 protein [Armatimonadetes bacterium]|nr:glycosyltransferase family 2 protein [Armatimonadota bacterium]